MRASQGNRAALIVVAAVLLVLMLVVFGLYRVVHGVYNRINGKSDSQQRQSQAQDDSQRGASIVGNAIGGALGTDAQGKSALDDALGNMAKTGAQIEQHDRARKASGQDTSAPDANDMQSAMQVGTGLLGAIGGALGGKHRVDPIDFHALQTFLPDSLPGMRRGTPQGSSKHGMGVHGTSASVDYNGADKAHIGISVSDISGVSGLIDLAGGLAHTDASESADGYEKDATLGGRSVHEKYESAARHGELSTIVARRFEIDVDGDNVDMAALEAAFAKIDLGRLDSMKDANPHGQ